MKEPYKIIHGDALKELPKIHGAHLCVTDAPYMLTSGGNTTGEMRGCFAKEKYNNSGNLFNHCPKWSEFMPLIYDCLADRAHAYFMADSKNQFEMQVQARAAGFKFHNLLYWDKGTCTPNKWYMKNAEYVGMFRKGLAKSINNCSSKQGIRIPQLDETQHPTEKPVMLMRHYIENSTQPDDIVIDPFMGTGTTGVAALMSGRRFIGIEIDTKWFKVAQARLVLAIRNRNKETLDMFA